MDPADEAAQERAVVAYIAAIKKTFGGEAWERVEPYAKSAWAISRLDGDPQWLEVRERLKAEWANR